ncbi:MAG TPA: Omp28-related outer membrane protein [Bacteroidia bacterium]|nr:Omp28-related outer membrane protein [Bacteroidia bacterium]HNT79471.1 Omp28-related outer membrane protein [Bacteroidia bacterium]
MRTSLLLITAILTLVSCSKKDESTPSTSGNSSNSSTVPTQFTQKVLIEQFTGAWNGACPDGIYKMENIIGTNANIIPVCIHEGDAMEISHFTSLMATFNNNQLPMYPSAFISRTSSAGAVFLNKLQWLSNITVAQNKTASCGLSISSTLNGNNLAITVNTGFCQMQSGDIRLHVYITENNIAASGTGYAQTNTNAYNDPNSPYFNAGSPISNFKHNHVLRKVVTSAAGSAIQIGNMVAGGKQTDQFTVDLSGINSSNAKIIAFISKTGTSATNHEVLNVQIASINQTKNWD